MRFELDDVHSDILARLMNLSGNQCCVVDSESQQDLNRFCRQLMKAAEFGKRFLFRSAASLLTALAQLPPQPVKAKDMARYVRHGKPGAVIVGSHVQKTTQQLNALLAQPGIKGVEVDVERIETDRNLLDNVIEKITSIHQAGINVVVYTSRTEKTFATQADRLAFGVRVSDFLMDIVRHLPKSLGFLISKGGITSNDVLSKGLNLRTSRVVGQILAGCSVVCCPPEHERYPDLPVVIFPGNVGDDQSLAKAYEYLALASQSEESTAQPINSIAEAR